MPGPDTLALLIPIVAIMIPIIAILTAHQRKMAEIIHSNNPNANAEVDALRQEVMQLRSLVNQQTIAMDDLRRSQIGAAPQQADVQSRLGAP